MYIARVLYPVKVLGPGNRIGIWVAGCCHECKGCSNPELWERDEKYFITKNKFREIIFSISNRFKVDGFTLTGGDPFFNASDLNDILEVITTVSEDVLVYTGYSYSSLLAKIEYKQCLDRIAVLIDSPYVESLNNNSFLRGSSNQQIIILKEAYKDKFERYLKNGRNEIQNFMTGNGFISVGIHGRDYENQLQGKLRQIHLEYDETQLN